MNVLEEQKYLRLKVINIQINVFIYAYMRVGLCTVILVYIFRFIYMDKHIYYIYGHQKHKARISLNTFFQ